MKLRTLALSSSALLLLTVSAQSETSDLLCASVIEKTEKRISQAGDSADAASKLGLSENQMAVVQGALDSARSIAKQHQETCLTMVDAARTILIRGQVAEDFGTPLSSRSVTAPEKDQAYEGGQRASSIIDQTAYSDQNKEVGEIHDILLKPDGSLHSVIIEGGGFLDIGDKHVRVNWGDLKFRDDGKSGVFVPLKQDEMTDFSLFDSDEDAGPKQGENLLRLSRIMYQTLRLSNDLPIGYVEDYLISEGKISSMLVRPNRRYANYYRSPYEVSYETTDFGYNPRRDYYVLPYDRSRLLMLSGIDKETIMNMAADGKADNETQ